jgi:hypothetical protein
MLKQQRNLHTRVSLTSLLLKHQMRRWREHAARSLHLQYCLRTLNERIVKVVAEASCSQDPVR